MRININIERMLPISVISDDLDNPVVSISKTTNDYASERDETEVIYSISGDSEAHMLA